MIVCDPNRDPSEITDASMSVDATITSPALPPSVASASVDASDYPAVASPLLPESLPAIPSRKPRKLPPEPLSHREATALLYVCRPRNKLGPRNRALIVLLWRCGLRCSEALALRPCDVDLVAGRVRVLHGKGDLSRVVGIDPQAGKVIAVWLEKRAALGLGDAGRLICSLSGRPVLPSYVRGLFGRLGKRCGIAKRVHPHGLRHTHAVELMSEGVSIGIISKQLGHKSIATTAQYLDHIAPQSVIEAMRGRAW